VLTYLLCTFHKGTLLLRIDDLDQARIRPEYVEDIFYSLEWLGIEWDQGPTGPDALEARFSQRHRLPLYKDFKGKLQETGSVFYCTCTRKDILSQNLDGQYPGTCRAVVQAPPARPHTLRVLTPSPCPLSWHDLALEEVILDLYQEMRDFVAWKKDGWPAYQLASLVDDLHFGINLLVRGEDLKASTAAQLYLAQLLEAESFSTAQFLHHPLIPDKEGQKLSKSAGAYSLKALRDNGNRPDLVFERISTMLALPYPAHTMGEMKAAFAESSWTRMWQS